MKFRRLLSPGKEVRRVGKLLQRHWSDKANYDEYYGIERKEGNST
jgi:hypothetical protein